MNTPPSPACIIHLDVVGYSTWEKAFRSLGLRDASLPLAEFHGWIRSLLDGACAAARHRLDWVQPGGEAFHFPVAKAATAHRLAVALHRRSAEETALRELPRPLEFRVGIATGEVTYTQPPDRFAAVASSTAARLANAGPPGSLLICPITWAALPNNLRSLYDAQPTQFEGKHQMPFAGHRWKLGPPMPAARVSSGGAGPTSWSPARGNSRISNKGSGAVAAGPGSVAGGKKSTIVTGNVTGNISINNR